MNAVLDIIIVAIIIICIALGYRNGFVKTVMNFLAFIIAFVMAKTFSPPLSAYFYSGYIKPNFVARVAADIESFLTRNINLDSLVQNPNPPDNFVSMLKGYGVDLPDVQKWVGDATSKGASELNEYVANNLVEPVAQGISYFLAFMAILLASILLLKIITALINRAFRLPVLNQINKIGGIILGFFYGLVLSYIFVYLSYYVFPYLAANTSLGSVPEMIDSTIFFKWFYEHSPLDYILKWF